MERNPLTLELSSRAIGRFYAALTVISLVLIGATLLSDLQWPTGNSAIRQQLDLKREGNAAVWFSSFVLLVAGIAAGEVSRASRAAPRPARLLWVVVAMFFVGLSVDETAQLHEAVGRKFTAIVGTVPLLTEGTMPAFGWLLALAPVIVIFIGCMVAALRAMPELPLRTQALSFAGLACWVGALGAEFVEAQLMRLGLDRSVEGVVEEGCELVGSMLFLVAFVELLRTLQRPRLSAVDSPASAAVTTPGPRVSGRDAQAAVAHLREAK